MSASTFGMGLYMPNEDNSEITVKDYGSANDFIINFNNEKLNN